MTMTSVCLSRMSIVSLLSDAAEAVTQINASYYPSYLFLLINDHHLQAKPHIRP